MKKFIIFLFIVATCSVAGHSQAYHYDVDGDGAVTSADVTALYDYLLGYVQQHEYVDLGLPSGTLWATTNVGAENPEDSGDYFAWGETTPKINYHWGTYQWCNGGNKTLTKYCTDSIYGYNGFTDDKTELDTEDDAATANWGPEWRMPSKEQQYELLTECTWLWTQRNGVNGYQVTSKHNSASFFLPAAGYRWYGSLDYVSTNGQYWSRTIGNYTTYDACYLHFDSGFVGWGSLERFRGFTVRAVRVSQK